MWPRQQWPATIATATNFSAKVACAAVLGIFGTLKLSWTQMVLLLLIHVSGRGFQS